MPLSGQKSWTESLNDRFDTLEDWTAAAVAVFLILQAAIMIANVIARQFGSDIGIANSTAMALIAWITFSVAAQQAREDEHFDINFVYKQLPTSVRQLDEIFIKIVAFIFSATFLYSAFLIAVDTAGDTNAAGLPNLVLYSPAVIGGLLLNIEYLRQLIQGVVKFRG